MQKIIIGNWKMNKLHKDVAPFFDYLNSNLKTIHSNKIIGIALPYLYLCEIINCEFCGGNLKTSAQNCSEKPLGALTGEIAAEMLEDLKVDYVIIGHSERRQFLNETDELINKKLLKVLKTSVKPILCIGETLNIYQNQSTKQHNREQLKKAFKNISKKDASRVVIAYEPIWAIGTGKVETSEIAQEIISDIRLYMSELYDNELAENILIQYGGSVKSSNVSEIMAQPDINGVLVGGASLDPIEFAKIIEKA